MKKYVILVVSVDDKDDSGVCTYADIMGKLYDTKKQAKEWVRQEALGELEHKNKHSDEDVIYYSDARTLDINIEDFDDELEIWRERDNGRGFYIPEFMTTRYSIKEVEV